VARDSDFSKSSHGNKVQIDRLSLTLSVVQVMKNKIIFRTIESAFAFAIFDLERLVCRHQIRIRTDPILPNALRKEQALLNQLSG
jgi:hypothetical protein